MGKKSILIVGAGISGLATAYYLRKSGLDCDITILEKQKRAGGWIRSETHESHFFEMGPKIFSTPKSEALLELLCELNMEKELIFSDKALKRFVLSGHNLVSLPQNPLSFLFCKSTRNKIIPLFLEYFKQPHACPDESIYNFITRRFGIGFMNELFDPLVQGIYAADPEKLSIRSCFGLLKDLEDQYGSIVKGFIARKKRQLPLIERFSPNGSLFSLRNGIESLVHQLISKMDTNMVFGETVVGLKKHKGSMVVKTKAREYSASDIFIALPVHTLPSIFGESNLAFNHSYFDIPSTSITSVCMGFKKKVLAHKGFGYLVSSKVSQGILGAVFDSMVFDRNDQTTEITLMLKGARWSEDDLHSQVHTCLKKHLGIASTPDFMKVHVSKKAIPVFEVGHKDNISFALRRLQKELPDCHLVGNYIDGVSVNDCIKVAKQAVAHWMIH